MARCRLTLWSTREGKLPTTSYQFRSRIGFAYRLGKSNVLRGAGGIRLRKWAAVSQMAQNSRARGPTSGQLIATLESAKHHFRDSHYYFARPFAGGGSGLFPAPTPFTRCNGSTILTSRTPTPCNGFRVQRDEFFDHVGRQLRRVRLSAPQRRRLLNTA